MPQIQIDDSLFKAAQRKASDGGYASVDDYVLDVLVHDLVEDNAAESPDLEHLFTPQRLAEIDQAAADVEAGNYFTADQVREHFKQKRQAWIQKNARR
jgi:hypothetical protein